MAKTTDNVPTVENFTDAEKNVTSQANPHDFATDLGNEADNEILGLLLLLDRSTSILTNIQPSLVTSKNFVATSR